MGSGKPIAAKKSSANQLKEKKKHSGGRNTGVMNSAGHLDEAKKNATIKEVDDSEEESYDTESVRGGG